MVQFNLLPDVKIEYIKAQRTRQTMISISAIVTVASVAILILFLGANQLEKKHMNDLQKDITSESSQLKGVKQIDRILTVQNQLTSLTTLHDAKPAVSRLFDYLNQLTPETVSLNNYTSDLNAHTVTMVGSADSLSSVNKYVDTIKFTTYTTDKSTTKTPAFTGVVLTSFGLSASAANASSAASFTINFSYDPNIFDNKLKVNLDTPSIITTRSEVDKPQSGTSIFTAPATAGGTK